MPTGCHQVASGPASEVARPHEAVLPAQGTGCADWDLHRIPEKSCHGVLHACAAAWRESLALPGVAIHDVIYSQGGVKGGQGCLHAAYASSKCNRVKDYLAAFAHQEGEETEAGFRSLLHDDVDQVLEALRTVGARCTLEDHSCERVLQEGVNLLLAERYRPGVDAHNETQDSCREGNEMLTIRCNTSAELALKELVVGARTCRHVAYA